MYSNAVGGRGGGEEGRKEILRYQINFAKEPQNIC
jgi:hypothetical protein